MIAWTSPRSTKLFHQLGGLSGLPDIVRIARERPRLLGQSGAASFALGCLRNRLACRFGSSNTAPARNLVEFAEAVAAKPKRERRRRSHSGTVARFALQQNRDTIYE